MEKGFCRADLVKKISNFNIKANFHMELEKEMELNIKALQFTMEIGKMI